MTTGKKIRSVIIDDEKRAIQTLEGLINEYCPELEIAGTGNSVKTGVEVVDGEKPELVFLDIDMLDGFGFDVIEQTTYKDYHVVFTTAYTTYAAKAFEFAAIHYLLKPISIDALHEAVSRYQKQVRNVEQNRMEVLRDTFHNSISKITIQMGDEYEVLDLSDIIYIWTDEGVTIVNRMDGRQSVVSQSLSHFEGLLTEQFFFRCHAKYLVNLRKVVRYTSLGRSGTAKLVDGTKLQVASRRKAEFGKRMKEISA